MGKMGVYRRILRSLKARTNQADKPVFKGEPEEAIAEIEKARQMLWDMPQLTDADATTVLAMDKLFRKEQAKWQDKVTTAASTDHEPKKDVARTLQDHPSKTNDGGSDGGL